MLHWELVIIPTECEHLINSIFSSDAVVFAMLLLSHRLILFHSSLLSSVIPVRSRFCTSWSILIGYCSFFLIYTVFCVNNNINNSKALLWEGGWTTWPPKTLLIYFFLWFSELTLMGLKTLYKHHSLIPAYLNIMQLFTN